MTKHQFILDHQKEWIEILATPVFKAFLTLIDEESPSRKTVFIPSNDRLHGASVFLNEIAGYERLRLLILDLATLPAVAYEPPTTFSEEEI
jgi:hypothetical protein